MHFNPHTILPIGVMIVALLCGIFVLLQKPKAPLNRIFFGICITFVAWFSFYIPFNFNVSDEFLIQHFKISYFFISFIPILTFTFITTYVNAPKNYFWFGINSLIGSIFSILSISGDSIVKGIYHYPWHPYPQAGDLHPLLVFHCIYLALSGCIIAYQELKNEHLDSRSKTHIRYMLAAIFSLTFGATDFIPNYGVPTYELGFIAAFSYLLISTTAIVKHQLMDIQVVVRKSLAYSILVTIITLIFLTLVLIIQHLTQNVTGNQNILNSIASSLVIALIFIPLKNKIQCVIDKIFFKGTQAEIAQENELLKQEISQTEKFKAIANLASGLAHEIKNPLTAIQTFTEQLPNRKNDPQFIENFTRIVSNETSRINELVRQLLTFAKPAEPKFEAINPNNLIEDLIKLLYPQTRQANIIVDCNLTNPPTLIQADPAQLKQALLNILLNAIEAMPNGGTLNIQTNTPIKDEIYTITISDTGNGIDPKDLPHIFEPFYSKKEKGTGLGLAITKNLINKNSGRLSVTSTLKKSTTFNIEFII